MAGKYRVEGGLLFLDESGQFPPHPTLVPVLAGILIPHNTENLKLLRTLAQRARDDVRNHPSAKGRAKPPFLSAQILDEVADAIWDNWFLVNGALEREEGPGEDEELPEELTEDDPEEDVDVREESFREMLAEFFEVMKEMRTRLTPMNRMLFTVDFLFRQYEKLTEEQPIYMGMLVNLYQKCAKWFRKEGILPTLDVRLDGGHLDEKAIQLHDFLLRFAVCAEYPDVYKNSLGMVFGVEPCPGLRCRVSSPRKDDGLVIAGIVAHVRGAIDQDRDRDGSHLRLWNRMVREGDERR